MRRLVLTLCLSCGAPATLVAQASDTGVGAFLRPLMPVGIVQAEILQILAPPRMAALTAKVQNAAKADPEWWRAHLARGTPGQPLPYDARMGMTESEYRELLASTDSLVMRPSGTATIEIEETTTGWRLGSGTTVPELRGVEVDTVAGVARTSFGVLGTRSSVAPSDAQRATGRWAGVQWRREEISPDGRTGVSARLAVGRLEASGQTLLFLDGKHVIDGQASPRVLTMVRWQAK
jgi:hypothetical protein